MHEATSFLGFFSNTAILEAANKMAESIDSRFDDERNSSEKAQIRVDFATLVFEYKDRGLDYTDITCPENN